MNRLSLTLLTHFGAAAFTKPVRTGLAAGTALAGFVSGIFLITGSSFGVAAERGAAGGIGVFLGVAVLFPLLKWLSRRLEPETVNQPLHQQTPEVAAAIYVDSDPGSGMS